MSSVVKSSFREDIARNLPPPTSLMTNLCMSDRLTFPQIWVESVCQTSSDDESVFSDISEPEIGPKSRDKVQDIANLKYRNGCSSGHPNKVIQSLLVACSTDVSFETSLDSSIGNSRQSSVQLSATSSQGNSLEEIHFPIPLAARSSEVDEPAPLEPADRSHRKGHFSSSANEEENAVVGGCIEPKSGRALRCQKGSGVICLGASSPTASPECPYRLDLNGGLDPPVSTATESEADQGIHRKVLTAEAPPRSLSEDAHDRTESNASFLTPVALKVEEWLNDILKKGIPLEVQYAFTKDTYDDEAQDDTWFQSGVYRVFDPYYDIAKEDIEAVEGKTEKKYGMPSGRCIVKLRNGDELMGNFHSGLRNGKGSIEGINLLNHGLICVRGSYNNSILMGAGSAILAENTLWNLPYRLTLEGIFNDGYLEGPVVGKAPDLSVAFMGQFIKGLPHGICWLAQEGQSWLIGPVNDRGEFTGDHLAYMYPDLNTALLGKFTKGAMVRTWPGQLQTAMLNDASILVPEFQSQPIKLHSHEETKDILDPENTSHLARRSKNTDYFYARCPSNSKEITCNWLLPDPYESEVLMCTNSRVSGAGDGLFARKDIPQGVVVSFYNGLLIDQSEHYATDNANYQIYVDWTDTESSPYVDIPIYCIDKTVYCASLAHKANHSFKPNCTYTTVTHPRFGRIPALMTLRPLLKGEEIFSHYKYDMALAPPWYQEAWENTLTSGSSNEMLPPTPD